MAALSGAPALAAPPERAALSPEGARLFRELVYHYEARQWKRGLKCADAILRVAPTHGETLAMKGLICNSMGSARKAEAHELVKLALKHDIRSHVCWHVYGLIHRSDANYAEAIKSYRNALRIEPEKCVLPRERFCSRRSVCRVCFLTAPTLHFRTAVQPADHARPCGAAGTPA